MFHLEVLVCKCATVDRFTASAIAFSKIARLDHEPFDDSMKVASFVRQFLVER